MQSWEYRETVNMNRYCYDSECKPGLHVLRRELIYHCVVHGIAVDDYEALSLLLQQERDLGWMLWCQLRFQLSPRVTNPFVALVEEVQLYFRRLIVYT